jgi:hypothetical protein
MGKTSKLPLAGPMTGAEWMEIEQGGAPKRVLLNDTVSGGASTSIQEITAGENLTINNLVYLAADSKWYKASNLVESNVATELRIVKDAAILANATGDAFIQGKITTSGLVSGSVYYVGINGAVTATIADTEGIFQRKIGTALSTTELEFLPDQTYLEITLSPLAGDSGHVINETPSGIMNGANATFNSMNEFKVETLELFLNGLKLKKLEDYNTSGTNTIQLYASPGATENLLLNYQKLN